MASLLFQIPLPIYSHSSRLHFSALKFTKSTLSAASNFSLSNESKSEAVFTLFNNYGFSSSQVESILHKQRHLLCAAEQTIKPKLDYFLDFGYSKSEVISLVSGDPRILRISADRLIRNLNLLKTLLGSEERVKKAVGRRSSNILRLDLETRLMPNVEILRSFNVPEKRILQAIFYFPLAMCHKSELVIKAVEQLKNLGVDPSARAFIMGFNAKIIMTQDVWDSKKAVYLQYGWSEENFHSAFSKHPYCMLNSEKKIKKMMEFFVEKLGWNPVFLSEKPILIDLSLESRVIPRCSVLNVLVERGFLGERASLSTILLVSDKKFERQYLMKYSTEVPFVLEVYEARIERDFDELRNWEERRRFSGH